MRFNLSRIWARLAGWWSGSPASPRPSAEERDLIARITSANLTFLPTNRLITIAETCRSIEDTGIPGAFIETGCALGGSAILIASLKKPKRPFAIHDVFGMIPPPTIHDGPDVHDRYRVIAAGGAQGMGGRPYYGYLENLYEAVQSNLKEFGIDPEKQSVSLIKGPVDETLSIDGPVAFAHIDVDWYEPVMTCLTRIFPHLVVGGSIIVDDYSDWSGCRKATDEYLRTVRGQFKRDESAGALKITRVSNGSAA